MTTSMMGLVHVTTCMMGRVDMTTSMMGLVHMTTCMMGRVHVTTSMMGLVHMTTSSLHDNLHDVSCSHDSYTL